MVQLCPVRGVASVFAAVCLGRTKKPCLLGQNPPPMYTAAPMPSTCCQGTWSSCPCSMLTERLSAISCPGATGKIPVRARLPDQPVTVCTCVCSVTQLCLTLCDPVDCSPPGSSVHGILQARILEWVAMPSSRGSSKPRDQTQISYVSCIGGQVLYH